jgi:Fe-S cluster biogenesis protein NfuA
MKTIEQILNRIEMSLDTMRPYLKNDGGNVEVVELTDDFTLKVRLTGTCSNCPQSYMTMKAGIEDAVKRSVPEVKEVIAVNVKIPQKSSESVE